MSRTSVIAACRVFFAGVALVAIATQLTSLAKQGTLDGVNYFSYFTIDSNLIAAFVLIGGAARRNTGNTLAFDLVRGAAVVYMSITGIVFTLLLSNTDVDTAIRWVNTVVHELMPLVMLADWLVSPPSRRLTLRQGLLWLSFPLGWIVYTLIRGILIAMIAVSAITVGLANAAGGVVRRGATA